MLWILPIANSAPPVVVKPKDKFAKIKLKPINHKTIFYTDKSKKGPCGKTKKQGCKCKM